jgi:hypothetical protein
VLKVIRGGAAAPGGLVAGDMADDEAIGSLLDDPGRVFDHLLEAHDNISEEEKGLLRTAFAELRAMQEEGEVAG